MADFSRDSIVKMLTEKTSTNNLRQRDLSYLDLSSLDLSNIDMEGSNLLGTNFQYSNLRNSNLSNCYLVNVNFGDADLSWANLENSILDGANFKDAIFRSVNLTNSTIEYDKLIETIYTRTSIDRKSLIFESEPHNELKLRIQKKIGELNFIKGIAIYQDDLEGFISLNGQNSFVIWLRSLLKKYNPKLGDSCTKDNIEYYIKPQINLIEKILNEKINGLTRGDNEILIPAKPYVDKLAVQLVKALNLHKYYPLKPCLLTLTKFLNISVEDAINYLNKREIQIDPNPLAEIDLETVVLLKGKFFDNATLSEVLNMVNHDLIHEINLRAISIEIISETIRKLNPKRNYTLIKSNGDFLVSNFFSKISIEKNGLFILENLLLSFDKNENILVSKKISYSDWSGNTLNEQILKSSQSVLSNAKLDFKSLLREKELINFNFYTPAHCDYDDRYEGKYAHSRGQSNKTPIINFEFDKLLTNGLKFSYKVSVTRGSDYWYRAKIQINDMLDNAVDFNDFYKYLEMLNNGEKFIQEF